MKKIVCRTTIKMLTVVVLSMAVSAVRNSAIISNSIAITQMQNTMDYLLTRSLFKTSILCATIGLLALMFLVIRSIVKDWCGYIREHRKDF